MAKSPRQKLKLLYIMKYLLEKTDNEHFVSIYDIIEYLETLNIQAERKSIYDDIETLRLYGLDIVMKKGKFTGYYVSGRSFELDDLSLLSDIINSSKFITSNKADELVQKIETISSVYEARLMCRKIYVKNRIHSMFESIYPHIDVIHHAINTDRKISFRYFEYSLNKEKLFKKNGMRYLVSPLSIIYDNEHFYLVAYDDSECMVKHYRIDRMDGIERSLVSRDKPSKLEEPDADEYTKKAFSMYGGTESLVKISFHHSLMGAVIDKFGKDIEIFKGDDEHFIIITPVFLSPHFYGWIFSLEEKAKILSPDIAVSGIKNHIALVLKNYS